MTTNIGQRTSKPAVMWTFESCEGPGTTMRGPLEPPEPERRDSQSLRYKALALLECLRNSFPEDVTTDLENVKTRTMRAVEVLRRR